MNVCVCACGWVEYDLANHKSHRIQKIHLEAVSQPIFYLLNNDTNDDDESEGNDVDDSEKRTSGQTMHSMHTTFKIGIIHRTINFVVRIVPYYYMDRLEQ